MKNQSALTVVICLCLGILLAIPVQAVLRVEVTGRNAADIGAQNIKLQLDDGTVLIGEEPEEDDEDDGVFFFFEVPNGAHILKVTNPVTGKTIDRNVNYSGVDTTIGINAGGVPWGWVGTGVGILAVGTGGYLIYDNNRDDDDNDDGGVVIQDDSGTQTDRRQSRSNGGDNGGNPPPNGGTFICADGSAGIVLFDIQNPSVHPFNPFNNLQVICGGSNAGQIVFTGGTAVPPIPVTFGPDGSFSGGASGTIFGFNNVPFDVNGNLPPSGPGGVSGQFHIEGGGFLPGGGDVDGSFLGDFAPVP